MNHEHIDIYKIVTEKIVAALEAGTPPWCQPWKSVTDPYPINAATGRAYRGVNFLMLQLEAAACGYSRNAWLTYRGATELGGQVRKGEKGTSVIFWKLRKINAKAESEPWPHADDIEERVIPLARFYTVFNTAQIDGLPAEYVEPAPSVPLWQGEEAAETLINASGADIRHGGFRAFYQPTQDFIQLPSPNAFRDSGSYYSVTLHELAHWTGHKTRLNRQLANRFGSESYVAEELVAEICSAFLCAHSRINGQLQHAAYVQNWLQLLRNDKRAIFVAATKAQNAADFLIDRSTGKPAIGIAARVDPVLEVEAEAA